MCVISFDRVKLVFHAFRCEWLPIGTGQRNGSIKMSSKLKTLVQDFSEKNLKSFLQSKIPSFSYNEEGLDYIFSDNLYKKYEFVKKFGEAKIGDDDLIVIVSETTEPLTERSGKKNQYEIAKKILKQEVNDAALFVFYDESGNFRFSYVKAIFLGTKKEFTEYKRYTYYVSKSQSNKTFVQQIGGCSFASLDEILKAFSVEPLNKQFYQEINKAFYSLIGGTIVSGKNKQTLNAVLQLPNTNDKIIIKEFAVRLIGRTIFCWFLKNKKSENGVPLVPEDWLSSEAVTKNYYHNILEKLFFLSLNKKIEDREKFSLPQGHETIPFLNGGLFEPHHQDFFVNNNANYDLKIPDEWFKSLFQVLEQFNFTIDENSSSDAEVSIDPEMLGTIFENLLAEIDPDTEKSARKSTGSFYTPREIVDYMVEQSLVQYLKTKTEITNEDQLLYLFKEAELKGKDKPFDDKTTDAILKALSTVTILDPACGSGAFPMGAVQKIVLALKNLDPEGKKWTELQLEKHHGNSDIHKKLKEKFSTATSDYARKLGVIQNSIYGVDIQSVATDISKLRSFLSLVIDENIDDTTENRGIEPLPNLEFKFVTANTLIALPEKGGQKEMFMNYEAIEQLKTLRNEYFQSSGKRKEQIKQQFINLQQKTFTSEHNLFADQDSREYKILSWKPFGNSSSAWFDPEWMFGVEKFDIVMGNPPYVSTKGVSTKDKKVLKEQYGFADDLYNHFFFKGIDLLQEDGNIVYITSKTFWTIQTKHNLRDLLLRNKVHYIFDTANPFKSAMVDTGIICVSKEIPTEKHSIHFLDGRENLSKPETYHIGQHIYLNTQNAVIFTPTKDNLAIYNKYGETVKQLFDTWWEKINTSKNITKNKTALEKYRNNLQAGDIALLGCLTDGGVGIQTGNNGKYIAVRASSKWANNIKDSRPKKLLEAIKKHNIPSLNYIETIGEANTFLHEKTEEEIAILFDQLKEEYGRDIFGQGYLFRIIADDEIANVELLSDDEKQNGIDSNKLYYVPYDKGDKDGNRWYLETPFAIAWTRENVAFLKNNSGKKGKGMPVVRNPQFYFREGFCWTDVNSTYLKCRTKKNGVFDVLSMSLFTQTIFPDWYFVSLINSRLVSLYVDNFVNSTSHFQINDARQLPIIIPTEIQLAEFKQIFDEAIAIQKQKFAKELNEGEAETKLVQIQERLDNAVNRLYDVK